MTLGSTQQYICDVMVDNPQCPQFMEVRIKASKTDPYRKGVSVFLGRMDLCPVSAVLDYMVRRSPEPHHLSLTPARARAKGKGGQNR